jgi:hypothetical protein
MSGPKGMKLAHVQVCPFFYFLFYLQFEVFNPNSNSCFDFFYSQSQHNSNMNINLYLFNIIIYLSSFYLAMERVVVLVRIPLCLFPFLK